MGRSVGKTIAGSPQPFVKVPVFWSARESQPYKAATDVITASTPTEGQQLRYCGIGSGFEDIHIHGDPGELKFIAYYIQGGQVTAVAR